jgi:hypothetical protein
LLLTFLDKVVKEKDKLKDSNSLTNTLSVPGHLEAQTWGVQYRQCLVSFHFSKCFPHAKVGSSFIYTCVNPPFCFCLLLVRGIYSLFWSNRQPYVISNIYHIHNTCEGTAVSSYYRGFSTFIILLNPKETQYLWIKFFQFNTFKIIILCSWVMWWFLLIF